MQTIPSLTALGSIKLNAAQNWSSYDATSSGWKSTCFLFVCNKTTWTDYYLREYLTTAPTSVYGKGVRINAGNDIETYGAHIQSWWNEVSLVAGGVAKYYAVYDQQNFKDTRDSKSSFLGIKYSTDRSISSSLSTAPVVTRLQSQNELTSSSGGDTLLQGTLVNAPGGALFQAGVGEKARADARIVLEGVKSTVQTAQTRESNYVLWQKQSGQGGTVETMALPTFVGGVSFKAPGGLSVQIPQSSDFKTQVQSLASQPGMGYLNTLTTRSDVNWQPVKLAFDKWSYSQSGLTPAGAALLAVAVAWATGGMGAELLGSAGTTTTTVGGVATTSYTTAGLVANAAFTSLASQASITLINNKGDVGKTLKDLGSSSTVKAALAAALTAGVLDKVGAMPGMQALKGSVEFSDKLTYNLINATGRALTNTAINGGSLEDALKAAIVGGIVDTAHGEVASRIKVLEETDYIAHKLAHALAGCVAGAAAGGNCQDGAIGAAVGEMVANIFKDQKPAAYATQAEWSAYDAKVLAYSKLIAGGVSAYSGGNAQTAITTAETAVQNNFLLNNRNNSRASQWASFKRELQTCQAQSGCNTDGIYARWTEISNQQQKLAMGSLDAMFGVNPTDAAKAGEYFGQAISSLYVQPTDICNASDLRCISFVQQQNTQAMAVYKSGVVLASSIDFIDGGGRSLRPSFDTPVAKPSTAAALADAQRLQVITETSSGTANSVTGIKLSDYLEVQQTYHPRVGTTLPGAKGEITVTAESTIGGKDFFDTNQTARVISQADASKSTLISDLVPSSGPNGTMGSAHAEISVIQRAYDAGLTQGRSMQIIVRGQEEVCTFCNKDIPGMVLRSGLNELKIYDTQAGITRIWTRDPITNKINPTTVPIHGQ